MTSVVRVNKPERDALLTLTFGGGFDEVDGAETDGALGGAAVETRDEPVRNVVVHPLLLRLHRTQTKSGDRTGVKYTGFTYK